MPLPSSGPLSISQIRNELINFGSSYSLRQLSAWAGKSTPDAISEFYGYSTCPPFGTFLGSFCDGCTLREFYADGNCGSYQFAEGNSPSCGCGGGGGGTCFDPFTGLEIPC